MKNIFLTIALLCVNGCAHSEERNKLSGFSVKKNFYYAGESKFFKQEIMLPVDKRKKPLIPENFDDAVSQIEVAISPEIMDKLIIALKYSCKSMPCEYSSPAMWDDFISQTQEIKVEENHTLSIYVSGASEFLGYAWHLDPKYCQPNERFCKHLISNFSTSPDMFADIVIRAAVAKKSGNPATLEQLISGMGDMVDKR